MGIFNRNGKEKQPEKRSSGSDAVIVSPNNSASGSLLFGNLFTNGSSMALSAVYRAVDLISDSVAMMPIEVVDNDGTKINHQLYTVFNDKSSKLTKYQFIKLMILSVLLRGNGFAYIERNGDGSVKSLRYIEANEVSIQYNKTNNTLWYNSATVSNKRIEPINMIHLVKQSWDGVNGVSILSYATNSIQNAKYTEQSALEFFKSGGNLSGVLKVQSSLTPLQITDIKSAWTNTYTNGGNGVCVLQGNMDYTPIQVSASDALMLESRKYNAEDISRFFGINPILLGDNAGGSQYGTISALLTEFVIHTLMPYVVMIEQEFTRKLLKTSESNFKINLDESFLLKGDKSTEASYYISLVNAGIITRNEAREKLGYNQREGCDSLIVPYTNINQNTIGADTSTNEEPKGDPKGEPNEGPKE